MTAGATRYPYTAPYTRGFRGVGVEVTDIVELSSRVFLTDIPTNAPLTG
jgi:hypothetical protein